MEDFEIREIESKKRSLKRYKKNKALIDRLENKLASIEDRLSLQSPRLTDMPRGGRPITTEDLIADKIELEERLSRLKEKGRVLRSEILEEIDNLEDPRYAEILESFFIDGYSLEETADLIGYGRRHVYRLYSEAVTWLALKRHEDTIISDGN